MKYMIYPFSMLLYVLCTLFLSIAYFFMVFVSTLTDAHEVSLQVCENRKDLWKTIKLWITGKK